MKVRLLIQISGMREGQVWPPPSSIVELPDDEARALVQGGSAEQVHEPKKPATK